MRRLWERHEYLITNIYYFSGSLTTKQKMQLKRVYIAITFSESAC